jgi:hypothetical protein
MNTNLFPSASLAATLSLLALNFASAPASAFTMTLDELGNCSFDGVPCSSGSSVLEYDPTGKVMPPVKVWVFTLPSLVYTTDINIYEPDGVTLSDHLRTIDPSGSNLSCTLASGKSPCANQMIYYSLDDLGGQPFPTTTKVGTNENADGSWVFSSGAPLYNVYYGVSDVPLPAALPLFASGLVGLGLLGWRRKRKALSA